MIQHKLYVEIKTIEQAVRSVPPCTDISLEDVAHALDISPRSLQRSLMEQGTSFSRILERARRQSAFKLLVRDDLNISEIARMLGYNNPSNFGRAFQRWTGQSPKQWRRRNLP